MIRLKPEPSHLALAFLVCTAASAQEGTGTGLTVVPRIGVMQSVTDNVRLTEQGRDAALITTVSPGISVMSNAGTLRGRLDYALNGITYLKTDQPSRVQNALTASGQAELISRTLFVDLQASIGQLNASAFGPQAAPTLGSQGSVYNQANVNQRETGTLAVSPSLRGFIGGLATFDLRANLSRTEVRGTGLGDSRSSGGSFRLNQLNAGVLSWWGQASTQDTKSDAAQSNRHSSLTAGLNYRPDPDWFVGGNLGRERSDYLSGGARDDNTVGVTAQWSPTPRTRLSGDWQRHPYGNSHSLNLEHRLARSVWRFSDSQNVTLGNTGASGGVRSNYDQYFLLFASVEPDPIKRDALVRAYLVSVGLSPDAPVAGGFVSAGPSRLRNQMFTFAFQGARSSLTGQINRSVSGRIGDNLNEGDLASSSRIEQRSYSLSFSHRLTPSSGLSLTASRQETYGDLSSQRGQLTSLIASWDARLGPHISFLLGARHSRAEGAAPYSENAAYANLTQQF